jgi:hypothetical protein
MSSSKLFHKLRSIIVISSSATLLGGCYLYASNDERFFERVLMPTFRLLPAETAHEIAVKAFKYKFLLPFNEYRDPETLVTNNMKFIKSILKLRTFRTFLEFEG